MADDVKLEGFRELDKQLATLGVRAEKRVVKTAIRKASEIIHREIVARTPVDTGRLKAALSKVRGILRSLKKSKQGNVGTGVFLPRRKALGIAEDATFYYPAAVEYGTKDRAGTHFVRSAVEAKTQEYLAMLRKELGLGIESEAKKPGGAA